MTEFRCECRYCGEFWTVKSFMKPHPRCRKCDDKNVKVRAHERSNVFGYEEDEQDERKVEYTD